MFVSEKLTWIPIYELAQSVQGTFYSIVYSIIITSRKIIGLTGFLTDWLKKFVSFGLKLDSHWLKHDKTIQHRIYIYAVGHDYLDSQVHELPIFVCCCIRWGQYGSNRYAIDIICLDDL